MHAKSNSECRRANPAAFLSVPVLMVALALLSSGDENEAKVLLEKAEVQFSRGRYAAAVKLYKRLAGNHAETRAGAIGIRRARANALLGWSDQLRQGPASNRVDVVIAGDGYTLGHLDTFEKQADKIPELFGRNEVLGEYSLYFNFIRATVVSAEDGTDGFQRDFDTAFNAHDSGKVGNDVDVDREVAATLLSEIPDYEGLGIVIVRAGQRGTGGGGIAAVAEHDPFNLMRAWGAAFAGLADELETDQGLVIPIHEAPNLSQSDRAQEVPWAHWIRAGAAGVGIYPGGLGRVSGVWKPVADGCAMEGTGVFCPVCREAIVLAIYRSCDPIESWAPLLQTIDEELIVKRRIEFEVETMRPRSHSLSVNWWVLPERGVPSPTTPAPTTPPSDDRRSRGPLTVIDIEPTATNKSDRKGHASFKLDATKLDPGRYKVICRVRDDTRPKGSKSQWVLSDPQGLLESEQSWWLRVPAR